jgi:hypothetical protein
LLNLKRIGAAVLALALAGLAGCAGTEAAPPTAIYDERFGFTVVGHYLMVAEIGTGTNRRQQEIVLTIGQPEAATAYSKRRRVDCGTVDTVVPIHVAATNTSAAGTAPTTIGVHLSVTVDVAQIKPHADLLVGYHQEGDKCVVAVPAYGITQKSAISLAGRPSHQSLLLEQPPGGKTANWALYGHRSNVEDLTSPLRMLYLRVSPLSDVAHKIPYRVTKVTAVLGVAGTITAGSDSGAVYVPLGSTLNPCDTIGKYTPMQCGTNLEPPVGAPS